MISLNETNLEEWQGRLMFEKNGDTDNFTAIWSSKDAKQKGSGIGLLYNNRWKKFYAGSEIISPYL